MKIFFTVAALVAGAASMAPPAAAQQLDDRGAINLQLENDMFGHGSDRHYTHGTRLSYVTPEKTTGIESLLRSSAVSFADWFPIFLRDGPKRVSLVLGQNMYSPDDIRQIDPDPNDRPYAGWLYVGAGIQSARELDNGERRLDNLEINLGVVGPWSLAEPTQKFVHEIVNSPEPKGWDKQIKNEPGLLISYERTWLGRPLPVVGGLDFDFAPHAGGALGNIYTYGAAGVTFRFGSDLTSDFGPPRILPGVQGSDFFTPSNSNFNWYVFAGIEGRLVARNIFLDGNTFADSRSVDKIPYVGDLQAGIVVTWQRVRFAFVNVFRTREFEGQKETDGFGALTISFRI